MSLTQHISRNTLNVWLRVCLLLMAWPSTAAGIGPMLRLEGTEAYFVTLEEADDIVAQNRNRGTWSLGNRFKLVEIRSVVYQNSRILAFYDMSDGPGIRVPLVLDFDAYFAQRAKAQFRTLWPRHLRTHIQQTLASRDTESLLSLDIPVELPSILGGGVPNFTITGRQRIEMAGRSEWTDDQVRTATNRVSRFPNVSMKQQQQFTVTGSIGQKINVTINQDSEAFSDLENSIRLRYEDRMDDGREGNGIIKKFEAGNVTLSLENAEFTGYTDQHSGLFGLKLESQIGGVSFVTIMSQEKGEGQSANFQAGAQGSRQQIRDTDYRRRTYFFVDPTYRSNFSQRNPNGRHLAAQDSIEIIRVFVADRNSRQDLANVRKAVAYLHPPTSVDGGIASQPDSSDVGSDVVEIERGDYRELQINEFSVDRDLGYIALNTPLQQSDALGVYYVTRNRLNGRRIVYGDVPLVNDQTTEATLRLLKSRQERPPALANINNPSKWGTWQYEWRNVYFLGKTEINSDGFDLKIFFKSPGGADQDVDDNGVPYIQQLGLDRRGINPGSAPDALIDIDYELINFQRGELIFPDLYPFAPALLVNDGGVAFPTTQQSGISDQTPDLYTSLTSTINANLVNFNKYYLAVEHKDRQAQYSLGRTNIIEGSEVVKLNGRKLNAGQDYIMLHEVGQIRFLTEEALDPNADVTVNYQFAPFFKPASNTLMGFQSRYNINDQSWLRGTLLYRADKSLDQKSRIGRETGRSVLWDIDTRLAFKPAFMTSLVNMIPFVETDGQSSLNISAEFAQSIPNPNTRGDAFIDDFEGSKEETDLGVRRGGWVPASPPDALTHLQRGRLDWYNPMEQVAVTEIYPTREVLIQDSRQQVLTMEFDPAIPDLRWGGTVDDNFITEWSQDAPDVLRTRWGGVMRPLTGATIDQTRSKFIEVWINGDRGELHIDLGSIAEDVNGNAQFDTEDDRSDGFGDNLLGEGEDTGIDKIFDEDEIGFDPVTKTPKPYDPATNPDPHGDNFFFDSSPASRGAFDEIDYSRINGTEDNINDPDRGRRPNTEDINNSGFLDGTNDFFKYAIDISPDHTDTSLVAGGDLDRTKWGDKRSWRLYRIPLAENVLNPAFKGLSGEPSRSLIEMARIWVTGVDAPVTVRIASIQIVGNKWQEDQKGAIMDSLGTPISSDQLLLNEETFNVSVKNTFDNPGDYLSPPGAIVEFDRVSGIQNREQSLVLSYENLQSGHNAQAFQTFFNAQDYTLYNDLRLFVHGSDNFFGDQSPDFFIRFGNGASDYYEYRTKLVPGWAQENEIHVIAVDFTLLKSDTEQARLAGSQDDTTFVIRLSDGLERQVVVRSGTVPDRKVAIVELENGRQLRVQGTPSLSKVRQFLVGVVNPYDHPLDKGEIWIDELRAGDVRRDKGMAGRISVDAQFADLMTFRGTFRQMGSNYRLIGQPEQGSTSTLMDLNTSVNVEKIFPEQWGVAMPVRIALRRSRQLPRLKVGSDIVLLRDEQRQEERREDRRMQFSTGYSKRKKSDNLLVAWTLDRFKINFSSSESITRSVTREDTSSTYNGTFSWDLTPRKPRTLGLFGWTKDSFMPKWFSNIKLSYLPSQLSFDTRIDRSKQNGVNRQNRQTRTDRFRRSLYRTTRAKMSPIKSLSFDYSLSVTNDMRADSTISLKDFKFGPETDHSQSFNIDVRPDVAAWLRPTYSFTTSYRENRNPELQSVGQSPEDRTVNYNNRRTLRSNLNVDRMLTGAFGRPQKPARRDDAEGESQGLNIGSALWRGTRTFIGILNPINITLTRDKNQTIFGLRTRPALKYRLGFTDQPGVTAPPPDSTGTITIQRDRQTESSTLGLDSGLKLFANLNITARSTWRTARTISSNTNIETRARTWPDLSARWSPPLQKLPYVTRVVRRLDFSSGYSRKVDQSNNINLAAANPDLVGSSETRSTTASFAPLFGITMDWAFGLTMRTNFESTNTEQHLGLSSTDQRLENRSLTLAFDYRIKPGFRIPFFGRGKKLQGSMNLQTQIVRSSNTTLISRDSASFKPSNGQRQFSVRIRSDYQFSRRVRGGLNLEWTNTENSITKEKRRIRQGGFWTEFQFN